MRARFDEALDCCARRGAELVEVGCPRSPTALAAYYLIMPSEASSNLARFDGMRFGLRVEPTDGPVTAERVMAATRGAGFGDEVKRRIILGTYALSAGYYDAYYGSAQKVRTLVQRDFAAAFERADVLVSPTAPTTAFKLGEKLDDPMAMYLNDIATIPANLAGVPGLLGAGRPDAGLPVGFQVLAPARADDRLYRVGGRPRGASRGAVGRPVAGPGTRAGGDRMSTPADLVDYDEAVARFDPVIGIEVHVELGTVSKMFDGAPTVFGAEPNTQVTPVSLGLPGSLPVVNETAVESAILIGLALNCQIAELCRFARKNYFYPDIPKNYQISQYDEPIAFEGSLDVELDDGTIVRVEIERAHMEEDAGKNTHVGGSTGRIHGAEYSLVDYNRGGHPARGDRHQADHRHRRARARGRPRLRADPARHLPRARGLRGADGARERPR